MRLFSLAFEEMTPARVRKGNAGAVRREKGWGICIAAAR